MFSRPIHRAEQFDDQEDLFVVREKAIVAEGKGEAEEREGRGGETFLRRALEGRERTLGPDHPNTPVSVGQQPGLAAASAGQAHPRRALPSPHSPRK